MWGFLFSLAYPTPPPYIYTIYYNMKNHPIKQIIREEIKRILSEDYQDKYKMSGGLITNLELRPQKEILSDIRAITGVTIVSEKELLPYNEQDKRNFKAILTVKVDGYPFMKSGGFDRDKMEEIAAQIRKVEGVVGFSMNSDTVAPI
jgi:hypothetical protein